MYGNFDMYVLKFREILKFGYIYIYIDFSTFDMSQFDKHIIIRLPFSCEAFLFQTIFFLKTGNTMNTTEINIFLWLYVK